MGSLSWTQKAGKEDKGGCIQCFTPQLEYYCALLSSKKPSHVEKLLVASVEASFIEIIIRRYIVTLLSSWT